LPEGLPRRCQAISAHPPFVIKEFLPPRARRGSDLKKIDLDIPRAALLVCTGVCGSRKSSVAFGTSTSCASVKSIARRRRRKLGTHPGPSIQVRRLAAEPRRATPSQQPDSITGFTRGLAGGGVFRVFAREHSQISEACLPLEETGCRPLSLQQPLCPGCTTPPWVPLFSSASPASCALRGRRVEAKHFAKARALYQRGGRSASR
jgi:hypothetical protein